ncbi:MAG: PPC domain-containing protein [Caldilineaceae bacterium]
MQTQQSSHQFKIRKWLSVLLLVGLCLSAVPGSLLAREMDRVSAQEEAMPLLLGQYVQQPATSGDVYSYALFLPEDGDYMISPDDPDAAESFTAAIYDEQGESVYEGPLAMDAITLAAGEYTVEVTAQADELLSFFMLGMIGTMSESERSPGKLYPGSVYAESDVSDSRYATINIPDVGYPQEVLLYFKAGEGDTFSVSVSGGNVSKYISSEELDMVRFYSEGGSYTLTVDAWERRSDFTAIVFLADAPERLALDDTLEATLDADADTQIFQLHLDDVYDDVTVVLTPGEESEAELSMSIVDRYEDGNFYTYADVLDDGSQSASTGALLPGDYYVVVTSYDGLAVDYTLSAEGVPGAPMVALEWNEPAEGTLEDGAVQYYRLDDVAAGTFVRVVLNSEEEDADLDLHAGVAQPLDQWSSATTGPNEEIILVAPADGTYFVQVLSYSGAADYTLTAEVVEGVGLIDSNQLISQTIKDDGSIVYGFAIDEPGQLLSVLLVSQEAADLDLSVVHFSANGTRVHDLSSASLGSAEIVSQAAADAGIYEVRVRAFGEGGDFALLVRVESPAALMGGGAAQGGSGDVILADDFSDPESGWAVDAEDGNYGYTDDAYQITVEPNVYRWVVQDDESYADISLAIEVVQSTGDPNAYAGLICRYTEDGYFYADVSPAGDFTIGEIAGEDVNVLADWTESDAIDTTEGAVNLLQLDCIGDTISAYVNGELLDSVTVEPTSGGYGFEAGNPEDASESALFLFDNLKASQP